MRKKLLILACGDYSKPLARLSSAVPDAKRLGALLARRNIGNFSVSEIFNPNLIGAQVAIHDMLSGALGTDLLVLYLSGHGVKDAYGRFYLALPQSDLGRLPATALSGRFIREQMADTPARKLLIILDACYAGAFGRDLIAKAAPATTGLPDELVDERGHVVMAAASAVQFAFETVEGSPTSIFTKIICDGIESGTADLNADGWITLEELFSYTLEKMAEESTAQKPEVSYLGVTGQIPIARAPKSPTSVELETDITQALNSPHVELRLAAANVLGNYAKGGKPKAYIARARLRSLMDDENDEVRQVVSSLLGRTYRQRSTTANFKVHPARLISTEWVSLDGRALKLAGEQAPKFASFGNDLPVLTTVALRLADSSLYIFATDRYRLDWRRLKTLACTQAPFNALVAADDFSALRNLPAESEVRITIYEREICFSVGASVLCMRRELRYDFPRIDDFIQVTGPTCSVHRIDLIEGIESLLSNRRVRLEDPIVIASTAPASPILQLSADRNPRFKGRAPHVDINTKGVPTEIMLRLDYRQLLEALDSFEEESVFLHFPLGRGPILILNSEKNADHRHTIMPIEEHEA
jgi:hypothetical protein